MHSPAHRAVHNNRARFAKRPRRAFRTASGPLLCSPLRAVAAPSRVHPPALVPAEESLPRAVSDAELARIWHRIRGELRRAVSDSTWHIWLDRVEARSLEGTTLVVEAPDD